MLNDLVPSSAAFDLKFLVSRFDAVRQKGNLRMLILKRRPENTETKWIVEIVLEIIKNEIKGLSRLGWQDSGVFSRSWDPHLPLCREGFL